MKVVLSTFGSHGDVHPFVGLAKALQRRGHEVTLHTSAYFESLARDAGVPFAGYGTAEQFKEQLRNKLLWHRTQGYKAVFGLGVKNSLRPSYDTLKAITTKETFVIGSSLALAARVIHDEFDCPGATVHLAPSVIRSSVAPPKIPGLFMPHWMPDSIKTKIWETGDKYFLDPLVCPDLNALRAEIGLAPVTRVLNSWWNHPKLIMGLWPEFYGPAASDWPGHFRHGGFPLYDEAEIEGLSPELEAFLGNNPPPIAFTPGSAMLFGQKFFADAVKTCQILNLPGLLLTRHGEQIPAGLPKNVIHVPYAAFSKLLPRCSAIVHHGGIGTTSQALKAGIPQVVAHFSHDQPDNAFRLERLGVGIGINATWLSARKLAKSLSALLSNPHTLRACKATATRIPANALDTAAEILETSAFEQANAPKVASSAR